MQTLLFACCDTCVIDERTKNLSLFNIIHEVFSPAFPLAMPRLSLALVLTREESEPQRIRMQLAITQGEQTMLRADFPIDFQGKLLTRGIAELQGFVLPAPGDILVDVSLGGTRLAHWRFLARQIGPQVDMFSAPPS